MQSFIDIYYSYYYLISNQEVNDNVILIDLVLGKIEDPNVSIPNMAKHLIGFIRALALDLGDEKLVLLIFYHGGCY